MCRIVLVVVALHIDIPALVLTATHADQLQPQTSHEHVHAQVREITAREVAAREVT